ncbi:hypothetical protein ACTXT7_008496 [Hymenolepis weldensis]
MYAWIAEEGADMHRLNKVEKRREKRSPPREDPNVIQKAIKKALKQKRQKERAQKSKVQMHLVRSSEPERRRSSSSRQATESSEPRYSEPDQLLSDSVSPIRRRRKKGRAPQQLPSTSWSPEQ